MTGLTSGHCHLGGIDIWAEEIATELGLERFIYPPVNQHWETGYKPRNLQIARKCDICYCITVKALPDSYRGMRFTTCYHCKTDDHVKSGGCWTVRQAMRMGKPGRWIIL